MHFASAIPSNKRCQKSVFFIAFHIDDDCDDDGTDDDDETIYMTYYYTALHTIQAVFNNQAYKYTYIQYTAESSG